VKESDFQAFIEATKAAEARNKPGRFVVGQRVVPSVEAVGMPGLPPGKVTGIDHLCIDVLCDGWDAPQRYAARLWDPVNAEVA